jgi:AcrR family transcriptional regulator
MIRRSTRDDHPRRRPGRPKAGGEDKRERILNESLDLFAVHGYAGTSLGDIAQAADISKAGLLHYFSTKEELFAAVLERRDERTVHAVALVDAVGIRSFLESWVDVIRDNATKSAEVALYTATSPAALDALHPAHGWLADHLSMAIETITEALEHGKEVGEVRPEAPSREMARALVALSDGLQVQWLCTRAERPAPGSDEADESTSGKPPYATDMVSETQLVVNALADRWLLAAR